MRGRDAGHADGRVSLHLEVPEAQDLPAEVGKLRVDAGVALAVGGELRIPERAGLAVVVVGVAVPEGAVDEDRELVAPERDVGLAGERLDVEAVAADAGRPQGLS